MIICGLKLTHDGAIALIEDGKLKFCIEIEKLCNNERFSSIEDTSVISNVLDEQGYDLSSIDLFTIDGWGGTDQDALAIQPRLEIGENYNKLIIKNHGKDFKLNIAPYCEKTIQHDVFEQWDFDGLFIGNNNLRYSSHMHVASHILSAYFTSPFSGRNESSYILVWDGGMYPRLYFFNAATRCVENLGPIFLFIGNMYTIFSQHFGPFKVTGNFAKDNLSVAGKVMAYIALGKVRKELFTHFSEIYVQKYNVPMGFANLFANEFKKKIEKNGYSDEDILCSFHVYLEELLIEKLVKKINRFPKGTKNLCLAGGCALNIKWNSAIRSSGYFKDVYIPPFPNDSGSAIGSACCAMLRNTRINSLEWNIYSGPEIIKNEPDRGWLARPCLINELGYLLYKTNEPVVFLNRRTELGPRALGNRSILASANSIKMKEILNSVKKRENYRPVSPICLQENAKYIFEPGIKDPFMLFDHRVKMEWKEKIPAVIHLDGTARLQTVTFEENPIIAELLSEYCKLSGIPLLCNTSANFKGCGFFPDVFSATKWNQVNYVWCDYTLYEKEDKILFKNE